MSSFFYFLTYIVGAGGQTQVLVLAWQALYLLIELCVQPSSLLNKESQLQRSD